MPLSELCFARPMLPAAPGEPMAFLLLDGAQRILEKLIHAVETRDQVEKVRTVERILPVIEALTEDLGPQPDAAAINLAHLYDWCAVEIQTAAVAGDAERLRQVRAQVAEIRTSWLLLDPRPVPSPAHALLGFSP